MTWSRDIALAKMKIFYDEYLACRLARAAKLVERKRTDLARADFSATTPILYEVCAIEDVIKTIEVSFSLVTRRRDVRYFAAWVSGALIGRTPPMLIDI